MAPKKCNNQLYRCCFCRYFQLTGYRWGYCEQLNVYVQGNKNACQVAIPPFTEPTLITDKSGKITSSILKNNQASN